MKFFSGILRRPFPINGLSPREETLRIPTRMPISTSVAPFLERKIGMVGMRRQKTDEKANWAKELRMKSRVNILSVGIREPTSLRSTGSGQWSTVLFFGPLPVEIVEVIADIHIPFLRIKGAEDGPLEPMWVFGTLRQIDKSGNSVRFTGILTDEEDTGPENDFMVD
jgi:hypothetical protein